MIVFDAAIGNRASARTYDIANSLGIECVDALRPQLK